MKDIIKRWNQLAGTEKKLNEQKESQEQNLYGNQFIQEILKEEAEFHPDLDEDLGSALADKSSEEGEEEAEGEEGEEDLSVIGDEEKATLSNSDLAMGLKQGAKAIAQAIPNTLNDEFADVMNSVKELAADKSKIKKLIRFIEKIK